MTRVIALVALSVIAIALTFGNYWWTFGLWPKSWTSFVLFAVANTIVASAMSAILESKD